THPARARFSRRSFRMDILFGVAGLRVPAGGIRLFLEVHAVPVGPIQVVWIGDFGGDDEECVSPGDLLAIIVFGEGGFGAIGHAVAREVAGTCLRGDDFQRASPPATASSQREAGESRRRTIPGSNRDTLQAARFAAWGSKREYASLGAGVGFHLEVIPLPGNVKASGHAKDSAD